VPDPSLVVLVGAAGAGKTTFAARHFAPAEVVSSDALRALVGWGEADQAASRPAFSILHRQVERRLLRGLLTVVDATNVDPAGRRSLLRRARANRVPAVAIVFDLPGSLVLARNAGRAQRVVDPTIVADHLGRLRSQVERGTLDGEGFEAIYRLADSSALDGAMVIRVTRERSSPPR
jgi:protein phosphatase